MKVLPMLKFVGGKVHKSLKKQAMEANLKDGEALFVANVLESPYGSLKAMLNRPQQSTHKDLKLKLRWLWDTYMHVINGAFTLPIYVHLSAEKCKRQGGKEMIYMNRYKEQELMETVDTLFGEETLEW